ncbi:hypothetical protein ACU6U9_17940 [Pseudomonas sp. HK3]|jgi:hypothetical protein
MKIITIICSISLALGAAASQAKEDNTSIKQYKTEANVLLGQLEKKDTKNIEKQSQKLVNISKDIIKSVNKSLPQCTEYFTALSNAADTMADLTLAEIESGYHADGLLPALKDSNCYHAKDLLVHPATVQAMARIGIKTEKEWHQAKHEIEEVLAHLSIVNGQF